MMTSRMLTLFVGLCLSPLLCAAQSWCGAEYSGPTPEVVTSVDRLKTEITIPVVVHVVYRNGDEYVNEERVRSQIDVLNEDFRAMNVDIEEVYGFFTGRIADMEINFELATEDPSGQPHSGIIEQFTTEQNLGEFVDGRRRLCYDDLGGSTAWCTECYLNIWVADLGLDGAAGLGIFPTQVANGDVPAGEDGVYIQPDRFGSSGDLEEPYHLGRTCTHELGHYFNLFHLWGTATPTDPCPVSTCCNDPIYDDFVEDTPFQVDTYLGECPGPNVNSCPSSAGPDNVQNFMSFAPDDCAFMFTEGQKTRVWEAIQTYRSGFLASNCLKACVVNTNSVNENLVTLIQVVNNGNANVSWVALVPALRWKLYSVQGILVRSGEQKWSGVVDWDLASLADGIYFLQAENGAESQVAKVFIARN